MNPLIAYITDQTVSDSLVVSEEGIQCIPSTVEESNHIILFVDEFECFEIVIIGVGL